jgi:hypothetical protein
MSLATTMQPHPFFNPNAKPFDPFGSNPDTVMPAHASSYERSIIAPQGRVPVAPSSLVPSQVSSRPVSRPDFTRGFGLDIPEEEEEAAEEQTQDHVAHEGSTQHDADISQDMDLDEIEERAKEAKGVQSLDGTATASQSRFHSRHVSKLSATLSIRSAGALDEDAFDREDEVTAATVDPDYRAGQDDTDLEDVIGEWTGSEDICPNDTSDGEEVCSHDPSDSPVTDITSRASANGPTPRMRNVPASSVWNVACVGERHNK